MAVEVFCGDFCIEQIANSGQCFRIERVSPGIWEVIALGNRLIVRKNQLQEQKYHIFECSQSEYDCIWSKYFDMPRDYSSIKDKIYATGDPYLIQAVNFGYGIRILQQDLWEVLISFIISQQNNISRIKGIIKKLCAQNNLYFPSPEEIASYSENDLKKIGLGYRASYVKNAAMSVCSGNFSLEKLRSMNYSNAITYLKSLEGVGEKVANCVALFGLQKLDAFPIDVWIKRILEREYGGIESFQIERFPGFAGIVQQYMFFYERFRRDCPKNT